MFNKRIVRILNLDYHAKTIIQIKMVHKTKIILLIILPDYYLAKI